MAINGISGYGQSSLLANSVFVNLPTCHNLLVSPIGSVKNFSLLTCASPTEVEYKGCLL